MVSVALGRLFTFSFQLHRHLSSRNFVLLPLYVASPLNYITLVQFTNFQIRPCAGPQNKSHTKVGTVPLFLAQKKLGLLFNQKNKWNLSVKTNLGTHTF